MPSSPSEAMIDVALNAVLDQGNVTAYERKKAKVDPRVREDIRVALSAALSVVPEITEDEQVCVCGHTMFSHAERAFNYACCHGLHTPTPCPCSGFQQTPEVWDAQQAKSAACSLSVVPGEPNLWRYRYLFANEGTVGPWHLAESRGELPENTLNVEVAPLFLHPPASPQSVEPSDVDVIERCARVCDGVAAEAGSTSRRYVAARECAHLIRALKSSAASPRTYSVVIQRCIDRLTVFMEGMEDDRLRADLALVLGHIVSHEQPAASPRAAEPTPEPVAWRYRWHTPGRVSPWMIAEVEPLAATENRNQGIEIEPLYVSAAPSVSREPTRAQIEALERYDLVHYDVADQIIEPCTDGNYVKRDAVLALFPPAPEQT